MAKNSIVETSSRNSLGGDTKVKGDIESKGDFRIDGALTGTIKTNGKVVIGATGSVDGEIICQNADIEGKVRAKVTVSELLTLKSTAKFDGEITTGKLAIEPGAVFSGACNMGGNGKGSVKPSATNE